MTAHHWPDSRPGRKSEAQLPVRAEAKAASGAGDGAIADPELLQVYRHASHGEIEQEVFLIY